MLNKVSGGRTVLYILLLVGAIFCMASLKRCNTHAAKLRNNPRAIPDTLYVAIEYSPMAMQAQGDTLAGFGYEMMKQVSSVAKMPVRFIPVVSIPRALEMFDKERYDVVIGELPEDHRVPPRPRTQTIIDGQEWAVNAKIQKRINAAIDSVKATPFYDSLIQRYTVAD